MSTCEGRQSKHTIHRPLWRISSTWCRKTSSLSSPGTSGKWRERDSSARSGVSIGRYFTYIKYTLCTFVNYLTFSLWINTSFSFQKTVFVDLIGLLRYSLSRYCLFCSIWDQWLSPVRHSSDVEFEVSDASMSFYWMQVQWFGYIR